eukprot:Pgem_evm1s4714
MIFPNLSKGSFLPTRNGNKTYPGNVNRAKTENNMYVLFPIFSMNAMGMKETKPVKIKKSKTQEHQQQCKQVVVNQETHQTLKRHQSESTLLRPSLDQVSSTEHATLPLRLPHQQVPMNNDAIAPALRLIKGRSNSLKIIPSSSLSAEDGVPERLRKKSLNPD